MRELTTWESLQSLVGTSSEGADLDFKETLDPVSEKTRIECAKDVAALANVRGGHILIGASTDMKRTRCTGFHGIDKALAGTIVELFEKQVMERSRPTPFISVRTIDVRDSDKTIVVVAVELSPVAPVGFSLRQEAGGHLSDKGWAFPYRVGSQTAYLHPDQFGAYESMNARRAAALLNAIPIDQRLLVNLRWVAGPALPSGSGYGDGQQHHLESLEVRFDRLDLLANVASFTALNGQHPVDLPLDQIRTVWRKIKGGTPSWEVSLTGSLHDSEGEWQYWPSP